MNISELDFSLIPLRKKRRPALACEQCRRRKIKCDRQTPCRPCTRTSTEACVYVYDSRRSSTTAPFDPSDTQFSVFEPDYRRRPTLVCPDTAANSVPTSFPKEPSSTSEPNGTVNFPGKGQEPKPAMLSPTVRQPAIDPELSGMFDGSDESNEIECPPLTYEQPRLSPSLHGTFFKTRYYGQSHWMSFVYQSSEVLAIMQAHEADDSSHGHATFASCKAIGRTIKAQGSMGIHYLKSPVRDMIPSRNIADRLVQAYFRTFQTVLGILHVPSFLEGYKAFWNNIELLTEEFGITLLLVMCIGSVFCPHETAVSSAVAVQWVYVASSWISSPKEKSRLNLDGVRIHSLLLLARQAKSIDGDTTWLSTGSLLRMAMHIGLHIDPSKRASTLPMSATEIESRRRLWAAVMELEVQACMASGGMPSIDSEQWDTPLPLNIEDSNLASNNPTPKSVDQPTQSSIQILLMTTLPIRLKIAKFLNTTFRPQAQEQSFSFETALALSAELSTILKTCSGFIDAYHMSSSPPLPFSTKIYALLTHRFVLALHYPFALKALEGDPAYYYSRKICLETSLSIFSDGGHEGGDDDFHRLRLVGSGSFGHFHTEAALFICTELADQESTGSPFTGRAGTQAVRKEMKRAVDKYLELALARMGNGDTNARRYVLVSCQLARAEEKQRGKKGPAKQNYSMEALKKSLDTCFSILSSQVHDHGQPPQASDHGRFAGQTQSDALNAPEMQGPNIQIQDMIQPLPILSVLEEGPNWSQWDELMYN